MLDCLRIASLLSCVVTVIIAADPSQHFKDVRVEASPHAAFIAWHALAAKDSARSYIEYGSSKKCDQKTEETKKDYFNQHHWITGLNENTKYFYRLVALDAKGNAVKSDLAEFTTAASKDKIPVKSTGKTITLDQSGKTYYLTENILSSGTGIDIKADNVTLDLNGHSITFGDGAKGRWHGIFLHAGKARIFNGSIIQSKNATNDKVAKYGAYGLGSLGGGKNSHISGLSIYVHQREAYPIVMANDAASSIVEYNTCHSNVHVFKSRHYPGNDHIRIDCKTGFFLVQHNICLNGPHRGITIFGKGDAGKGLIKGNDIQHEQGYTNGYAILLGRDNINVQGNRITSCSRGIHITKGNIEVFDNYLNLTQHMVYDDRPQGSTTFRHYYTENHGIKLENCGTGVKIHGNIVISHQPLPDPKKYKRFSSNIKGTIQEKTGAKFTVDGAHFSPATPLNFHVKGNVMAEVYNNEFIATTAYPKTRDTGSYHDPGEWAACVRLASEVEGPSADGKYAVYIHDNIFRSNDAFFNMRGFTQTLRIENNTCISIKKGPSNRQLIRGKDTAKMEALLKAGKNTFK